MRFQALAAPRHSTYERRTTHIPHERQKTREGVSKNRCVSWRINEQRGGVAAAWHDGCAHDKCRSLAEQEQESSDSALEEVLEAGTEPELQDMDEVSALSAAPLLVAQGSCGCPHARTPSCLPACL